MEQEVLDKPISAEAADEWPEERKPGALRILSRHTDLIRSLILRDIRSRYKQSVLGIAWALLQPLAMAAIFTLVFSCIMKVRTGSVPYPIFCYVAVLPWTFFGQGISTGTECLTSNFNLVTKIYFPREVFPISAVVGKMVDLALGMLVLVPLFLIYHAQVTWTALMVVPLVLIQTALMLGLAMILSSANVFYRDVRHVIPLLMQVWMYMSPVIYGLDKVPARYLPVYMLNPMASLIDSYRRVALLGRMPDWGYLGIAAAVSVIALIVGYRIFKRLEPRFAEMI